MADKKKTLTKIRGIFAKNRTEKEIAQEEAGLYSELYQGLEDVGMIDYNYSENFDKIKGQNYPEKMEHVSDFTLKNCGTILTFILRGERFAEGTFFEAVSSGNILKLLNRAIEVA